MVIIKKIIQKQYENKITCFTINAFDDDYYKDGLPVDEANRNIVLNNKFKFGKIFDFKVFDYNHPLVIECKEKYKEFFDREDIIKSVKTDVVKLYILSKLPYHLYIDDDALLLDDFEIKDKEDYFFGYNGDFCCIYNGNNLDIFKEMLEVYPFDDKQLDENLDVCVFENKYEKEVYSIKRACYYLMNYYKPLRKFKKESCLLNSIRHYFKETINACFFNYNISFFPKKIYLLFNEDIKINIEKENFYFIFTKEHKFIDDILNYTGNVYYLYNKIFTKEYIIKRISNIFKIKHIKECSETIEIELNEEYKREINNKITCFTVNIFDNGYYKDELPVNEANRKMWLYNVERYNHIFDFKVFDYTHPLVIECKEKYKDFFDREDIWPSIKADVVRLYILSKLPYHLYIDDDAVLLDNFEIKDKEDYFFGCNGGFYIIYNGNKLDVFKKMLEVYPFKDENLELEKNIFFNSLKNTQKKELEKNNCTKRIDYYLMNCYKPFKKFKKEDFLIDSIVKHHYNCYIKYCFYNNNRKFCPKKIYLIFDEDVKINIEKENFYFIFTKEHKFIDDILNYTGNILYLYDKLYTKEYIIKRIREYFKIENIKEYNKITEIYLDENYESPFY